MKRATEKENPKPSEREKCGVITACRNHVSANAANRKTARAR